MWPEAEVLFLTEERAFSLVFRSKEGSMEGSLLLVLNLIQALEGLIYSARDFDGLFRCCQVFLVLGHLTGVHGPNFFFHGGFPIVFLGFTLAVGF